MIRHPIVVIEGADCSGKSTLARHLQQEFGFKIRHLTYRFTDRMFHYHHAALEMCLLDAETQPVVLDRWWPSEGIYAQEFRGGSPWPMMSRLFDRVAIKYGIVYVFCQPSNLVRHVARFNERKRKGLEMYSRIVGLIDRYDELYTKLTTNLLQPRVDILNYDMDTHGRNLAEYCQHIMDTHTLVNSEIDDYWLDRHERTVAGNTTCPAVIFVGEKSAPKTRRPVWPFFEHGNSSLWLANALEKLGLAESDICWINIHDSSDQFNEESWGRLAHLVATQKPLVVAFGRVASTALYQRGVEHWTVNHPQYSRRFAPNSLTQLKTVVSHLRGV